MYEHDARTTPGWRPAVAALAVAAAANLGLLLAGRARGASFTVPDRTQEGAVVDVGLSAVLWSSVLPLAAGLAVTALVARRRPRARRALQVLAAVITLASLAFSLSTQTDTGTRVLLAAMHLVAGGAYLAAVRVQRPHPATGHHHLASAPERTR